MTLLKRKRVLAAQIETTPGTAETLTAPDAAFNAWDIMIQPSIEVATREGQGGFANIAGVVGGYKGVATFKTDLGWDGTSTEPSWADTFLPACGFVKSSQIFTPRTEAPGSNVKTLTIGCFMDGMFKSIKGAAGTAKIVMPTGQQAYIEWTFTGVWVTPSDVAIISPTYPTALPLRASGGATTYNAVTICSSNVTIDFGNEVLVRECPTDASGYAAAIITNRNIRITADPESKLVATRDDYGNFLDSFEAAWHYELAAPGTNAALEFDAPKAQVVSIQEADRNSLVVDQIEWQCNRNSSTVDEELSITFTAGV